MIDQQLREIIEHHLSRVLEYDAFERFENVIDKESFLELIGNDPAFAPFFLNNPQVRHGTHRRKSDYQPLSPLNARRIKSLQTEKTIGMAFEVRSCYQIGDSKRIQADRDMSLALRKKKFEPVMIIFCASSLTSPVKRLCEFWHVYEEAQAFEFVKTLTGFDLYGYFQGENQLIRKLMNSIFDMM